MTTSLSNAVEAPTTSGFAALNLSEPVLRAIEEVGYTDPTPVQAATYPIAITGRDIIVQARTGTGKTAAFGIPLVDKLVSRDPWVQALVLAPTRELAVQSQRELARLAQYKGLHTVAIYGGAPMGRQIDELKSGAQLVSGTPGRVLDHLRRGTFDPSRLKVLVLDEMDEMLSMGFAKELNAILELIPARGRRQTMCFSATVDGEVRRHAERHMHEPEMISLSSDAVSASSISHHVYMVSGRDRISDLVRVLEVEDPESALIFCNMRSETERVAMGLKQAGFNADWLNGDLPQRDRERIMASTREGKLRYLVATDVAARGIDISHLTHVINFSFPESAAVYVHRTGRTGRAGRTGCAISLVGPEELGRLYYLRLEYKISPIERSLPTHGELKTRAEIDRIGLLEAAFADRPNPNDLAVARRLLTHPENERILAGLLHTFFGTKEDADEEAAAARRSKLGPDLDQADRAARERERDRPRGRERERGRDGARAREPGRDRDRGEGRTRDREGRESEGRDREASRGQDCDREASRGSTARDHESERAPNREQESSSGNEAGTRERESGRERSRDREPRRDRDRQAARGSAPASDAAGARKAAEDFEGEQGAEARDPGRGTYAPGPRSEDNAASRDNAFAKRAERDRSARDASTRERSTRRGREQAETELERSARLRDNAARGERGENSDARERDERGEAGNAPRERDAGERDGGKAPREREARRERGQGSSARGEPDGRERDARGEGSDATRERSARERSARGEGADASREGSAREREPGEGDVRGDGGDATRERSAGERDERRERGEGARGTRGRAESRERGAGEANERGGRERSRERDRTRNGAGERNGLGSNEAHAVAASAEAETLGQERATGRERERVKSRADREPATADSGADVDLSEATDKAGAGEREREGSSSSRRRRRSRERSAERKSDVAPLGAAGDAAADGGAASDRAPAPKRPRRAESATPLAAVDGELFPVETNEADEASSEPTEPLEGLLYLNVGKRDGLRIPEVVRLLRDSCELSRGQIGRVRVRDRYTFVDVPEGRLAGIIETLSGQVVHDKPLAPERAKTAQS